MELFNNIRLKAGKAMLSVKVARLRRKAFYINLNQIKTIGIVWNASRLEDFGTLSRFYQKMHECNVDVNILGYFPGKSLPDQYTAIRYLTCFKKAELDFFYRPISKDANDFIKHRFDVLIDINFEKLFPLLYISSLSLAGLKVGLCTSEPATSPFDLMIELRNSISVDKYLEQVLFYLDMINSKSVKTAV